MKLRVEGKEEDVKKFIKQLKQIGQITGEIVLKYNRKEHAHRSYIDFEMKKEAI